eukprot:6778395-Prymnesium_polylepis.1
MEERRVSAPAVVQHVEEFQPEARRGCFTVCLTFGEDLTAQYHEFDALQQRLERDRQLEQEDHCPPKVPCPLGSILVCIVALPATVVLFVWLDIFYINQVVASLFRLNHRQYLLVANGKFVKRRRTRWEACDRMRSLCIGYVLVYFALNLAFALVWVVLIALYPLVGVAHAIYEVARRTYDESDMWEESLEVGLMDYLGVADSEKEQCAETCATWCVFGECRVCRGVLY